MYEKKIRKNCAENNFFYFLIVPLYIKRAANIKKRAANIKKGAANIAALRGNYFPKISNFCFTFRTSAHFFEKSV